MAKTKKCAHGRDRRFKRKVVCRKAPAKRAGMQRAKKPQRQWERHRSNALAHLRRWASRYWDVDY